MRFFLILFIFLSYQAPSLYAKPYKHQISMAMIFQNDAQWLKEWIEYHRLIGVEHFYLYNNLSTDHYKQVLAPYIKKKIVTLTQWPHTYTTTQDWTKVQVGAYNHAIELTRNNTNWLAVLDSDEFLVPIKDNSLNQLLSRFNGVGGIVANWQMFGTSYVKEIPTNKLMIEMLVLKGPSFINENRLVKTIFHPRCVRKMVDPHFALYKKNHYQVNMGRKPVRGSVNAPIRLDLLRVHHYWSRTETYFFNQKCARRSKWNCPESNSLNKLNKLNQIEDKTIFRFIPALRKRMGFSKS